MTDQEAFEAWKAENYDFLSDDEACALEAGWYAALAWLRSQQKLVGWLLDGEFYEVQQHRMFGGDGAIPNQIPLYAAPEYKK